jgi:hypothetical protein
MIVSSLIYTEALRANAAETRPGARGEAIFRQGEREFLVERHVRPNAVWRFGRLFLRCPRCDERVTRLYVPTADAWIACRRCWGLSYPSQKQSYVSGGLLGAILGSWGKSETGFARERRRVAAQKRYAERRTILSTAPGSEIKHFETLGRP